MSATACNETISIIVEQSTRRVLDRVSFGEMLSRLAKSLACITDRHVEVLLVGGSVPSWVTLPNWVRHVELAEEGYYAAKNAGAREAHGELLVFWDSDCRANDDYLRVALDVLSADQALLGVTGITHYDGSSWLSRLNTLLSFGYLRQPISTPTPSAALAHNVVLRRAELAGSDSPFGPYRARSGGDTHLTRVAAETGRPLKLVQQLVIWHEDPSFSPSALLERHLREHFNSLVGRKSISQVQVVATVLSSVVCSFTKRRHKVDAYERFMTAPIGRRSIVTAVLSLYLVLDFIAAVVVVGARPLLNRWLTYQFGMDLKSWNPPSLS